MEKYLTTEDAANFLGVTPSRVRQLIIEKRLKSEKRGRDHLLLEYDVMNFAEHGKKKRGRKKSSE